MKSETLNKIKESRRKYFQEVMNQQAEREIKPVAKNFARLDAEPKPEPEPELDLERVLRDLIENLPSISMPRIIDRQKVQHAMLGARKRWSKAANAVAARKSRFGHAIDQRTEKVRSRFYTYMLVLFDS